MADAAKLGFEDMLEQELAALRERMLECHSLELNSLRTEVEVLREKCEGCVKTTQLLANAAMGEVTGTTIGEMTIGEMTIGEMTMSPPVAPVRAPTNTSITSSAAASSSTAPLSPMNMGVLRCRPEWVLGESHVPSKCSDQKFSTTTAVRKSKTVTSENGNVERVASNLFVLHPESRVCFIRDLASMVLVMFDVIMTPLQVFVSTTLVFSAMDWVCGLFWTLDIGFTFMRAVYVGTEIVWNRWQIALVYFKSWFLIDLLVVLPDWVLMLATEGELSFLRVVRLLRLMRLVRVIKLERVIQSVEARIHSALCTHTLKIARLVFFIVVLNHLLACVWYWIGVSGIDGWARDSRSEFDHLYGYATSLHWSITQFHASMEVHPITLRERLFAVCVVLIALIVFSQFLSSLTDMMIQLQRLRQDKNRQHDTLQGFLAEHDISTKLSMMVKKTIEARVDLVKKQEQEMEVLQALPRYLLMDIYDEVRVPILSEHTFFQQLRQEYPRAVRMLCFDAISQRALRAGETIFSVGDPCCRMLFVEQGNLVYHVEASIRAKEGKELWKLRKNEWICEVALWVVWSNVGELVAVGGSLMLEIDATKLSQVLGKFEKAYVTTVLYAQEFVDTVNRARVTTDLHVEVPASEDEPDKSRARWTSFRSPSESRTSFRTTSESNNSGLGWRRASPFVARQVVEGEL